MENKDEYKPIPVAVAKKIAEKFDKSIVIVFAHDPVHGLVHTTTYGTDPQNKAWAAQGGEIAIQALGGMTEHCVNYEDYRLQQAQKLFAALKGVRSSPKSMRALAAADAAIKEAEKFLGVAVKFKKGRI